MFTSGSTSGCHKVGVQYSFLVVEAKDTPQYPTVRGPSQNKFQTAKVSRIAGNQLTHHSVLPPSSLALHWKERCQGQAGEEARNSLVPSLPSDPLHTDAELRDATMGPKGAVLSRAQHYLAQHKLPDVGRIRKEKINSMKNTVSQHSMVLVLTRVLPP